MPGESHFGAASCSTSRLLMHPLAVIRCSHFAGVGPTISDVFRSFRIALLPCPSSTYSPPRMQRFGQHTQTRGTARRMRSLPGREQ